MGESFEKNFQELMEELKHNKTSFFRFVERMKQFNTKKNEKLKLAAPTRSISFPEEVFFEDNEDITVYIDAPNDKTNSNFLPEHSHSFFELVYVYSGNCAMSIGQKEFHLPPKSISIFNTEATHKVIVKQGEAVLINILVRKSTLSSTILNMVLDNDLFFNFFLHSIYDMKTEPCFMQFYPLTDPVMYSLVYQIVLEYHQQSIYSQTMMRHLFCGLITALTRQYWKEKSTRPSSDSNKLDISQVVNYISDHCNTVTLEEVANYFHYNANYISRFIQKQLGKTFTKLLNDFKMNKAKHYLHESDFAIDKISSLLGYSDRASFEKAFKKHFKLTQAQYRKSYISIK